MKSDLFELSDRIKAMRSRFADFEQDGVLLGPDQVRRLRTELKALTSLALDREHEISRHRWNEAGRSGRDALSASILHEAARPGTNLVLLGRMERPFSDGGSAD